jgi:hypothetical protein
LALLSVLDAVRRIILIFVTTHCSLHWIAEA